MFLLFVCLFVLYEYFLFLFFVCLSVFVEFFFFFCGEWDGGNQFCEHLIHYVKRMEKCVPAGFENVTFPFFFSSFSSFFFLTKISWICQ